MFKKKRTKKQRKVYSSIGNKYKIIANYNLAILSILFLKMKGRTQHNIFYPQQIFEVQYTIRAPPFATLMSIQVFFRFIYV